MAVSKRQLEERKMRQERILDGALEVFKSEGLDGATIDEIAARAGFGKATLYYYFHSKEEVFTAIMENGWQNLWSSLETVIAGQHGPRQTFINLLLKIAENVRKRPGLFMGLVLMGYRNKLVSQKDVEKLLNQLITDPMQL